MDPSLYKEFKQQNNYQALQDTQINKIISAQQRGYDPNLLGKVYTKSPSSLYQQYLNETGLIHQKSQKPVSKCLLRWIIIINLYSKH